jgi:hypothetical protein
MNIIRSIAVMALALASAGCATDWVKIGATEQELLADRTSCERDAESEYAGEGGRLEALGSYVDRRGFFERCMIARGWRNKATETASVESPPPATDADLPLRFPVYSR